MQQIIRTGVAVIAIASLTTWVGCKKTLLPVPRNSNTETTDVRSLSVAGGDAMLGRTVINTADVPALCGTVTVKKLF